MLNPSRPFCPKHFRNSPSGGSGLFSGQGQIVAVTVESPEFGSVQK